jgi:hypothetical protein
VEVIPLIIEDSMPVEVEKDMLLLFIMLTGELVRPLMVVVKILPEEVATFVLIIGALEVTPLMTDVIVLLLEVRVLTTGSMVVMIVVVPFVPVAPCRP